MAVKDLIPNLGRKRQDIQIFEDENPIPMMRREMNQLFNNFFHNFQLAPFNKEMAWNYPKIDIKDKNKELVVEAELPGMDEKDVNISLSNNVLSISGEKRQEKEEKKGKYYHVERSFGSFHRDIPLHCKVEFGKAQATFKKGVLKVTLPKTAEAQKKVKSIPIHTN